MKTKQDDFSYIKALALALATSAFATLAVALALATSAFATSAFATLAFVAFATLAFAEDDYRYKISVILGLIVGIVIAALFINANPQIFQQSQQNITATTTIQPLNLNCTQLTNYINTNISNGNQQLAQSYIQIATGKGCIKGS